MGLTLGFCSQPREIRAADSQLRLDKQIKDDFMAGFHGDQAALERACAAAAKILEAQPRHAEAMVWLGAGTLKLSGDAFVKDGDQQKGTELWKKGNGQMDQAVELEPDNIAVRVTRGSTLLVVTRSPLPPEWQQELLHKAVADFTHVIELHKDQFGKLPEHSRGELLAALADGYDRLGEKEKSRAELERIVRELPGTEYAKRAGAWMDNPAYPVEQRTCVGCHQAAK
jgi:tetratricopeptide (TPR) repeat protein